MKYQRLGRVQPARAFSQLIHLSFVYFEDGVQVYKKCCFWLARLPRCPILPTTYYLLTT